MIPPRVNGERLNLRKPVPVTGEVKAPAPSCPKRCDIATPPEHFGGDQYVCVCCGTQFTWKGPP